MPILIFYGATAQRDVQFWDVGEMQTVPWIFGIAHPTGFPLYTMLGWVFSHAIPFGSIAWRLSFFSSVAMCATGWFVYRLVLEETQFAWAALASALLFDATSIAWSRGTRADVHPLAAALEAASIYALFRWRRTRAERVFVAACASLGAALAVHPVALFIVPAALALAVPGAARLSRRTAVFAALAFLGPLCAYATIPVRSAILYAARRDPTLALGLPPGGPFWDYAHTANVRSFFWFISGAQFHREAGAAGFTDIHVFFRSIAWGVGLDVRQFGTVLVVIAAAGLVAYAFRKPSCAFALALLAGSVIPFAFAYAEEADKERYLLMTLFATAVAMGIGSAEFGRLLARSAGKRHFIESAYAVALTGFAAFHFYENRNIVAINRDTVARRYVEQIRERTPKNAILIADWVYVTPLAYAAYVEQSLNERIVVAGDVRALQPDVAGWFRARNVTYVAGTQTPESLRIPACARRLNATVPFIFSLEPCAASR